MKVEDNLPPVLVCQDVTIQLNSDGFKVFNTATLMDSQSDNCGGVLLSTGNLILNCANVGSFQATLTAEDSHENSTSCTQTVTVEDKVAPVAQCQDITVQLDEEGNAAIGPDDVDNGSSDACGVQSTVLSGQSFSCADVGSNTVTLTVTDVNNNTSTCTATVTVEDNIAPVLNCSDRTVSIENLHGVESVPVYQLYQGGVDNCDGAFFPPFEFVEFGCGDVGTTQNLVFSYTDASGNTGACTSVVTIVDNTRPAVSCKNINVSLDENGQAQITANQVIFSAFDACGIQSRSVSQTDFDCDDIGPNVVQVTVTDNHGNSRSCNATVTVKDAIAPTAVCRDATVQLDPAGQATLSGNDIDNGSFDECGGIQSTVPSQQSFSCGNVGANTVTLTVTDVNNNASTCTATVTVEDNVAPDAVCRNVTVQLDENGAGSTTAAAVDNGSGDACGIQSAVLSRQSFSCADMGANTVTLTVTDVNNNASTCSATVTVEDNLDPEVVCSDITVTFNGEGSIGLDPVGMATASDNCAVTGFEAGLPSIACDALGEVVPVTVTAQDAGGNTASCTSHVTVEGLPCGWMSMPDGIGCTNGNEGNFDPDAETFTLLSSGCYTPSATSDESGYIKYQLCGNGTITAHIAGLTLPGYAGIVMRESDAPGAKKVAMAYQGASAIARYVRYTDNGAAYPSYINAFGARWLRIVRTGNIFRGYYSVNGVTWTYAFAVTVPMSNCIQVGLIAWGTNANSVVTATFDHVVIDPPFGGGVLRGGDEDQTEAIPATDLPVMELWPNPSTGIFTLTLDSAWSTSKTTSMVNIQVADELGRVIREEKVDAAIEAMVNFDLSGQAPGMYFVKITDAAGGTQVQKLVIAR